MIDFLFSWISELLLYWFLFFVLILGLLSRLFTSIEEPLSLPPMTKPVMPDRKDDKNKDYFLSWIKYLFLKTAEILYRASVFFLNSLVIAFNTHRVYWSISLFLGFICSIIVYFII